MKLMHLFFDVSMTNSHNGLTRILLKDKKSIKEGEYAVFINKNWMGMKMLTPNNTILYYKSKSAKTPINPQTIKYLPSCVNGGELNYSAALRVVIENQFKERF